MTRIPSSTAGAPAGTSVNGPLGLTPGPVNIYPEQDSDTATATPYAMVYPLGPFTVGNLISNKTSTLHLAFAPPSGVGVGITAMVAPKKLIVVGVSASRNSANSAGTWQPKALKNGTAVLAAVAVTGRSTYIFSTNFSSATRTFAAGDRIGAQIVTSTDYAAATGDVAVYLWVV